MSGRFRNWGRRLAKPRTAAWSLNFTLLGRPRTGHLVYYEKMELTVEWTYLAGCIAGIAHPLDLSIGVIVDGFLQGLLECILQIPCLWVIFQLGVSVGKKNKGKTIEKRRSRKKRQLLTVKCAKPGNPHSPTGVTKEPNGGRLLKSLVKIDPTNNFQRVKHTLPLRFSLLSFTLRYFPRWRRCIDHHAILFLTAYERGEK